jgi:hypothetical protein
VHKAWSSNELFGSPATALVTWTTVKFRRDNPKLYAAFVAAHWFTGLQDVWGRGMLTFDTLWYHGPFAARIAGVGQGPRSAHDEVGDAVAGQAA